MNDASALAALHAQTREGRARWNRTLVLRTDSNYDMQPHGTTAAESANHEKYGSYAAHLPPLGTAYPPGERVVKSLRSDWPIHEQHIPTSITAPTPTAVPATIPATTRSPTHSASPR